MKTRGIWTPHAEVLCVRCNRSPWAAWRTMRGDYATEREALAAYDAIPVDTEQRPEDMETRCDACAAAIFGEDDAFYLAALRDRLGHGTLEQTGGMCAALRIDRLGAIPVRATHALVTYGMVDDGRYEVGIYDSEDGETLDFQTYGLDEAVEELRVQKVRKARIVLPHDDPVGLQARVQDYLPSNYTTKLEAGEVVVIGIDDHGWTLDGYVIPRLASGLMPAKEVKS